MTIIVKDADGTTECFESASYLISTEQNMHPAILSLKVYSGTRLVAQKRRRFAWWYKHVTFKTAAVQAELKRIAEQQKQKTEE